MKSYIFSAYWFTVFRTAASAKKEAKQEGKKKTIKMIDKETGKGKIEITTSDGTSEGGKVPVLFVEKVQIGFK